MKTVCRFKVQMNYKWINLYSCTKISTVICHISSLIWHAASDTLMRKYWRRAWHFRVFSPSGNFKFSCSSSLVLLEFVHLKFSHYSLLWVYVCLSPYFDSEWQVQANDSSSPSIFSHDQLAIIYIYIFCKTLHVILCLSQHITSRYMMPISFIIGESNLDHWWMCCLLGSPPKSCCFSPL